MTTCWPSGSVPRLRTGGTTMTPPEPYRGLNAALARNSGSSAEDVEALCECGCGERTTTARYSDTRYGAINGQPQRFISGHNMRVRPRPVRPAEERFWEKVDKNGPGGCWVWIGARYQNGYGSFYSDGGTIPVHRFSYELLVGPIPDGLAIDHVYDRGCRSILCVNPAHLEPVTHDENIRRWVRTLTHCKRGHEFTPENTHVRPNGRRRCIACATQRRKERTARERAERTGREAAARIEGGA